MITLILWFLLAFHLDLLWHLARSTLFPFLTVTNTPWEFACQICLLATAKSLSAGMQDPCWGTQSTGLLVPLGESSSLYKYQEQWNINYFPSVPLLFSLFFNTLCREYGWFDFRFDWEKTPPKGPRLFQVEIPRGWWCSAPRPPCF